MDDTLVLGGNIELTGFRDIDSGTMIVVKKIIGNYARKFSNKIEMEKLAITVKPVHGDNSLFEVHSKIIINGKDYRAEVTDHNIFFVLDKAMKKLEQQM